MPAPQPIFPPVRPCISVPGGGIPEKAELMGIGHPLVDAIIAHLSHPSVAGEVSSIDFGDDQRCPKIPSPPPYLSP